MNRISSGGRGQSGDSTASLFSVKGFMAGIGQSISNYFFEGQDNIDGYMEVSEVTGFQPKLLHVRIRVNDLERSIKFYTELFGFTEVNRSISPAGNQLAFLQLPNNETLIELCYSPDYGAFRVPEDLMHFAISVQDLEEFRRKWEPAGIEFWPSDGPVNGRFYFIDDPDGYEIEVMKAK